MSDMAVNFLVMLEATWCTLQSEASQWARKRDAYAQETHKATLHTAEMQSAAQEATQELTRLKDDIAQAKKQLLALERCSTLCCPSCVLLHVLSDRWCPVLQTHGKVASSNPSFCTLVPATPCNQNQASLSWVHA